MGEYFLVLTKKKKFHNESQKKIFLSKYYCGYDFDFSNGTDILLEENLNYDVMPDVLCLKEKLLPAMAESLNKIHKMHFSHEFWFRLLSFWWLPDILRNIYMKYFRIKYLADKNYNENLHVALLHRNEWLRIIDTSDYCFCNWEEKYNFQLWTRVIEKFDELEFTKEYKAYGLESFDANARVKLKGILDKEPPSSSKNYFINGIMNRIQKASLLDKSKWDAALNFTVRIISEYLHSPLDARCYMFSSGFNDELFDRIVSSTRAKARPIPNEAISRRYRHVNKEICNELRKKMKDLVLNQISNCNTDEKRIIEIVLDEMPMCFLELFYEIRKQYDRYLTPNVQYLLSQHGAYVNTAFLFYAVEMHERFKTELRGIQHGGNYQTEYFYWGDSIYSDKLYCWGKDEMDGKFISSAPYKLLQYQNAYGKSIHDKNRCLLYIDTAYMPYLCSDTENLYYQRLIDESIKFLQAISKSVRDKMLIRQYTDEYGWDIKGILNHHINDLSFDVFDENLPSRESDFLLKIKQSEFCIFNILSTGWLEVLASKKPFIAFLHEYVRPLRDSEKTIFDQMYDVQILHHSGESAARLLNEIHGDIEGWWNEPYRQAVVKEVRERYWNDFGNPDEWWLKEIQSLVKS